MSAENPDAPPTKVAEAEESEEEPKQPVQKFNYYLKPEVSFKILATKWGVFTILGGFTYFYHFAWTVAGVDNFCDYTRLQSCGAKIGDEASSVLDTAIALVTIFHMIEWLRQTVFLTTALVNVNLMPLYYFLSINVPFGFIAMLIGIATAMGEDGQSCKANQPMRQAYLRDQLYAFFLYIFMCFAHIIMFKIKGLDWCHDLWLKEEDEDDD